MSNDALGTAGGLVSAAEHRIANTAMLAGLSTGILDARTGVFAGPNSAALITGTSATGTMTVNVAAFQAATTRTSAQGTYLGPTFESGVSALAIAAAPASNSRIDVVYVKQQDSDASVLTPDGSTAPLVAVVTGTAAGSPTKPAIPTGALELGTVTVAAGATSTNGAGVTIANTARQTVARGGVYPTQPTATAGGYIGQPRYNLATLNMELWNGTVWDPYATSAFVAAVGKRVVKTGTQTITNAWLVLNWDQADSVLDPGTTGIWNSGVPGDLVAPVKGIYAVSCGVQALTNVQIRRNAGGSATGGTQVSASNNGPAGPTTAYNNCSANGVLLNAGDYVTCFGFNTTSQAAGTASGYTAFFSLALIARI